jgi:hypothetical protein
MTSMSIAGYMPNDGVVRRLARDLVYATRRMDGRDWALLFLAAAGSAGRTTLRTRLANLRNTGRIVVRGGTHVLNVGPGRAACDVWQAAQTAARDLPVRTRAAWHRFQELSRGRQADEIAQMVLTWMVFYAAAGGNDLEGGLPDTDLLLGIGNHRSVFSHSILLGLETEMALRFGLSALHGLMDRMPQDRHPVWNRIAAGLDRYGESTLTGMWLGIGAHLLKDANLLRTATKPVSDLPWSMPMAAHQAFLAANGVASMAVSTSSKAGPNSQPGML